MGSGGSILLVPLMVYMLGMDAVVASGNSLIVVGISSAVIALTTYKFEEKDKVILLWFGLTSSLSIMVMRAYILPIIPDTIIETENLAITKQKMIMLLLAFVMALVARSMIYTRKSINQDILKVKRINPLALVCAGVAVGLLSGLLGIGGGFVIVPLLIVWLRFEVSHAISLSIVLIAFNAILGFIGGLKHLSPDYNLLVIMTVLCLLGMKAGVKVRRQIDSNKLKVGFGYFILSIGIFIVVKEYFV
jgi:uncharacterized membrane protein YfcA